MKAEYLSIFHVFFFLPFLYSRVQLLLRSNVLMLHLKRFPGIAGSGSRDIDYREGVWVLCLEIKIKIGYRL